MSRDTWDPEAVDPIEIGNLVARAVRLVDARLTGVTISGGEPFEQPEALAALVASLRLAFVHLDPGIDVLCYSGFTLPVLRRSHGAVLDLLDAVVPGPYRADSPTDLPWRGSANQSLVALSSLGESRLRASSAGGGRAVQVNVVAGRVELIGIPREGDLARVEARLAEAGVRIEDATWRP